MKHGESAQDYLSRVSTVVSKMRSLGEQCLDSTLVAKLLRSLTPKFDHVVAVIEESKDLSTFIFDELMGSLLAHEERLNQEADKEEDDGEDEFKLFMADLEPNGTSSDIWFLNSGCFNHMTGIRSLFKELDKEYKLKVRLSDDKQMEVEGKGTIAI
ncbi:uncharacterized protein LOC110606212 [Manihot esculenta]|uniref:uncharacterized protein LOC110606212 n=1 Tax=Manihot esculenta TaxID=3983 RepID=UPI000B5D88E6|nr:uncharacterized protein LOC110606212 [Manihot esculenta]